MNDETYAQLKELVYLTHPFGVTLCEVVVDCYDVNALACECVEVNRHCSNEGLTFTRLHFRDSSLVKDDTADYLNSVRLHAENTPCCFPYCCKCFRKKLIECLAVSDPLLEFISLACEIVVAQLGILFLV